MVATSSATRITLNKSVNPLILLRRCPEFQNKLSAISHNIPGEDEGYCWIPRLTIFALCVKCFKTEQLGVRSSEWLLICPRWWGDSLTPLYQLPLLHLTSSSCPAQGCLSYRGRHTTPLQQRERETAESFKWPAPPLRTAHSCLQSRRAWWHVFTHDS